jgi:hypothetical protein
MAFHHPHADHLRQCLCDVELGSGRRQHPSQAARTASGVMGFLQMGFGSLCSQFGTYLGGHFATSVPLNLAIVVLSLACASTMILLVPRGSAVATQQLIEQAEVEETGLRIGRAQRALACLSTQNCGQG